MSKSKQSVGENVNAKAKSKFVRSALSVALGMCIAGGVYAQSTTGSIYGNAPEGATVVIKSKSGFTRTVTVDESGRYNIGSLPVGDYVVTAKQGDETVGMRNVPVLVGAGSDVSFVDSMLEMVEVVGQAGLPDIDVSSTDTRVVITAEDLQRMPIGRSAEDIALLAPGVNGGASGYFGDMVSFGGAGISENAYYINGFLANDPLSNLGGFGLPFGAINQQETYTGGYGAKYGRSSGGVINQVGARGDDEVRYGTQVAYQPKALRSTGTKGHFQNMELPEGYGYTDPELAGQLYERKDDDYALSTTYSAYVSGPIIQDKLYGFLSYESEITDIQNSPNALQNPRVANGEEDTNKLYAKLDWNITDGHLLEFTYMSEKEDYSGSYNAYDVETGTRGERLDASPNDEGHESKFSIVNYTGFLTDNLTLNAMYGHGDFSYYDKPSGDVTSPYITYAGYQNPALNGGTPIEGLAGGYSQRDAEDTTDGLRVNLEWVLGDHTLTFGIDNMEFEAVNEGTEYITDRWVYLIASDPNAPISSTLNVAAPGGDGYYAYQLYYKDATSMKLEQDAYYIEDRWQVTDDVLLSLGLRNDKFTNYNNVGKAYLESDDQWAPRLGVSWDVMGDSSLKVFANAGRYYLAMPNNVAIRGASASTYTRDYYTYSGINADGSPIVDEHLSPGPVSSNGEYGDPVDPKSFAPSDLENMYQDEYLAGFEKTLGEEWNFGAKFTFRDLKSSIDDVCDPYTLMEKSGFTPYAYSGGKYLTENEAGERAAVAYCYMFNPGGTNTISLQSIDADGTPNGQYHDVTMSADDWGMPDLKREYTAVDLFLERPFDGKWEARVDYTYSKLQGNNEGQVKSEFGQDNISKTQDWDVAEIMAFSDGYLANDRRHQLKLRGSYALTEELMIGANMSIKSGMPVSCLGLYNPDGTIDEASDAADPVGYGPSYHTCFGSVAEPGKERTPWTRNLDLGLTYVPAMLDDKLTLSLQVFNVLDEQKATQLDVTSEDGPYTVSNTYKVPLAYQTPRYAMLTATLNF
ncbi:TonB-dependent receptor [Microbulbifer aggregans]|uniref:TonB-dependent receptor n=1 Tax=Microbulbifer aggregans TaxID=1769779 RepID=UPI001CFF300F|nr:TonB-dependent receptor [Microbulbifer aggregans]